MLYDYESYQVEIAKLSSALKISKIRRGSRFHLMLVVINCTEVLYLSAIGKKEGHLQLNSTDKSVENFLLINESN